MALARLSLLQSSLFLNDTGSDDEMKLALQVVTDMAARYCGRMRADGLTNGIESATYTDELHSGRDALANYTRLYPRQYPVTSVTAVKIWDGSAFTTETAANYSLVDNRYIQYPATGYESSATYGYWPVSSVHLNIKLTYVAGYVTTDWATALITASFAVPKDLEHAIAAWAADLWLHKGNAQVSAESFGPRAVTYVTRNGVSAPAQVAAVLDGYCKVDL